MSESKHNAEGHSDRAKIALSDAIDQFFTEFCATIPFAAELKQALISQCEQGTEMDGVSFGRHGLEVHRSGSELFVDAEIFRYVLERIRAEGLPDQCPPKT